MALQEDATRPLDELAACVGSSKTPVWNRIRKLKGWDWDQWSKRVSEYLQRLEFYFSPDLFIIGGGVSKRYEKFLHLLKTESPVVPAQLLNDAGIVGAALLARKLVMA